MQGVNLLFVVLINNFKRGVGFEPTKTRSAGECSNRCATRALIYIGKTIYLKVFVVIYKIMVYSCLSDLNLNTGFKILSEFILCQDNIWP